MFPPSSQYVRHLLNMSIILLTYPSSSLCFHHPLCVLDILSSFHHPLYISVILPTSPSSSIYMFMSISQCFCHPLKYLSSSQCLCICFNLYVIVQYVDYFECFVILSIYLLSSQFFCLPTN